LLLVVRIKTRMLAEWNVELGADDPTLEIPWSSEDSNARFFDLKLQPELLLEIPDACSYPELAEFLSWANSSDSPFETAKCDAWTSRQIEVEEEVFGEPCKFGSYIDLLFANPVARFQFSANEKFVQGLARLLRHAPEMASAAEFTLRRCQDHRAERRQQTDCFYITFYLNGYGEDERQARKRWAIALNMAQNAMIQYFATRSGIC
jgi:hypothetical protein